jgi:hypothetical protein
MDTPTNNTPESLARSERPSFDDDDSEEVTDSSTDSARDESDSRRGAFDMFEKDDEGLHEEPTLYDLFEQHAEPEPPLEELAVDEQSLVAEEATEINLDAANQELVGTEPGSPEEAAAIAGATFNEAVRERIDGGQAPNEQTLDAALIDTAEIMGLDPANVPEETPPEVNEIVEVELPEATEQNDVTKSPAEPAEAATGQPEDVLEEASETENEPSDDSEVASPPEPASSSPEDDPASTPIPPGGTGPATASGPSPGHPAPPVPGGPAGPGGGAPPPGRGPGPAWGTPGGPPAGPGFAPPAPTAPWMGPGTAAALVGGNALRHNRRHRHWPYVVAGGVVGYLIGRRRGRINTEKKLLPVQQKLERQVGDMQFQLALREAKIRKLAYLTAINQPHIHAALPKRLKELQELQKARIKKEDFERVDKARAKLEKLNNPAGEVAAVGLAAKVVAMTERSTKPELSSAKHMELSELLRIAEQLPIEDRNLRVLYESGRLTQHGLRRVIEAYLRGERFDRILSEELQQGDRVSESKLPPSEQSAESASELPAVAHDIGGSNLNPDSIRMPDDVSQEQLQGARHEYLSELVNRSTANSPPQSSAIKPAVAIGLVVGLGVVAVLIWG